MPYRIGVDVGGTFTDLIATDEKGNTILVKTSSTPSDTSKGMLNSLEEAAKAIGLGVKDFLKDVSIIIHGTTVATNAVLTLNGAKTGVITTKGFRDIVERRKCIREKLFDYRYPPPKPLVSRYLTIPIEERITWNGEVHTPLNEKDVYAAIEKFKKEKVNSIAVCFLHSYKNPKHELRVAEILAEKLPHVYVSLSHQVLPQIGEYERFSTTVLNSYVGPILSNHVLKLHTTLENLGYQGLFLLTHSSGGVYSAEVASKLPVKAVLSGPASGPMAGTFYSDLYGNRNVITTDMGGTSFDVALLKGGIPQIVAERRISRYALGVPMIDIHTIGAGGGSIAYLDSAGLLHVGPKSAAADPGPACYGKGGDLPTVTDADVILGYINPDYFAGGKIKLKSELAEKAIKEKIAVPLGKGVREAAEGIFSVINSTMADAIKVVSTYRGENVKEYVLLAAGGAGPTHAAALAKELGITKVIACKLASFFCALGSLLTDIKHDYIKTYIHRNLGDISTDAINAINDLYREMEIDGRKTLQFEGVPPEAMYFVRSMDMRYAGQFHEVEVDVPTPIPITKKDIPGLIERFHIRHENLYAYRDTVKVELINLRLIVYGRVPKYEFKKQSYGGKDPSKAEKGARKVVFNSDYEGTVIYDGDKLRYGNIISGPAVIEEETTTVVIPPDFKCVVGKYGDPILTLEG